MINEPAVDLLIDKLGTEGEPLSRYALCVVAAKHARQIVEQSAAQQAKENPEKLKELALACTEIVNGKVIAVKD